MSPFSCLQMPHILCKNDLNIIKTLLMKIIITQMLCMAVTNLIFFSNCLSKSSYQSCLHDISCFDFFVSHKIAHSRIWTNWPALRVQRAYFACPRFTRNGTVRILQCFSELVELNDNFNEGSQT